VIEKLLKLTAIGFYVLASALILDLYITNTYFPLKSVFDLGINPFYIWIIIFLISLSVIPVYIIIKKQYEILGEELPYQDRIRLVTVITFSPLIPAAFAIISFVFTQNLLISVVLLIYGALFGIVTYFSI
jgi:hypothetical protein